MFDIFKWKKALVVDFKNSVIGTGKKGIHDAYIY